MSPPTVPLLDAALGYAEMGWHVFPLAESGKAPITDHGHLDATTDADTVRRWWTTNPEARIGVSLRPSGLIAIDFDIADGKEGDKVLARAEAEHGWLPRELVQRSGRGGGHILLQDPAPGPDGWTRRGEDGGEIRGNLNHLGFGGGVDVKCNGYIVVAPSGSYRWEKVGQPPAVPPSWLAVLRKPANGANGEAPGIDAWQTSCGPVDRTQLIRTCEKLHALGTGGEGKGSTYSAILTIFHDEGLGMAEGWPLLCAWNDARAKPHSDAELRRQVERVASRPRETSRGNAKDLADIAGIFGSTAPPPPPPPAKGHRASSLIGTIIEQATEPMVPTPWPRLNEVLGGGLLLRTANVVVSGPGKGKTSFALQMAAHHAETSPAIYYGAELTPAMLAAKVVSQRTGRSWLKVLRYPDEKAMRAALEPLALYIVSRSSDPLVSIKEALAEAQREHPNAVPLVVIDYLQLLADITQHDMRIAVAGTTRALLEFAEGTRMSLLALSQSSRGGADKIRDASGMELSPEALIATGAESSEIERSAANLMVLSWEGVEGVEDNDAILFVAKGRFTGGRRLPMIFHGPTGVWREAERIPMSPAERDREAEIIEQVMTHARGLCGCGGKALNAQALMKPPHKVVGKKELLLKTLKRLEVEGKLRQRPGFGYRPMVEPDVDLPVDPSNPLARM